MADQSDKARSFAVMQQKGNPLVLFNIWDAGTAKIVAGQGATAIALGSHAVAEAHGYEDGEHIPLELVLANAKEVVDAVDLPVTLDFESGYGQTPADVHASILKVLKTGVVGVNIEDKNQANGELYSIDEQVERLRAVRAAADEAGIDLVINARTDLFKDADPADHNDALLDKALERAAAFADAGASCFFAPLVTSKQLAERLCSESPLPVNLIWIDGQGLPTPVELKAAGVSRISYGPGPWLEMNQWLADKAEQTFSL